MNINNEIGRPIYDEKNNEDNNNEIHKKNRKKMENKINNEEEEEEDEEDILEYEENTTKKTLFEIADNYIFTPENYLQMIIILQRIKANIPVIIMGDKGIGKTSLITKLSELVNNGNKNRFIILNIHSSTIDKDIISFLEKNVIPKARQLEYKEKKKINEFKEKGLEYYEKKIWVFFKEINVCKSLGLITEILCKHTYQGNPIPYNIVFLASCLPYKLFKKESKEKSKNKTVYALNHLPNTLWNFIFNFGNLNEKDEKKLIINDIMKSRIRNFFVSRTREVFDLKSEMIIKYLKLLFRFYSFKCNL